MIQAAVGETVRLHFVLLEEDGVTPLSGLDDSDFTKELIRDTVESAVVGTVAEVATTGRYHLDFVPDAEGSWYVDVFTDETDDMFSCLVAVGPAGAPQGYLSNEAQLNVAYDESATTLFMEAWLDRNGQSVAAADLVSCEIKVYDDAGTLLFTETSSSPDANGRFSLSRSGVTLTANRPYNATVTVVDSRGTVVTFQAFTTVG